MLDRSAAAFGLMAATIAVGAFLARGQAILRNRDETRTQRMTIYGGFLGLLLSMALILIDAVAA